MNALVERVVDRLVAELAVGSPVPGPPTDSEANPLPRWVDATTIARELGVERDWVYEHANQLGAVRLGGPRGRLRFDRTMLAECLSSSAHTPPLAVQLAAKRKRPRGAATPPGQDTGS